jgi:uncharacterized protein YkwD
MKKIVSLYLLFIWATLCCMAQNPNVMINKDDPDLELLQNLVFQKINKYRLSKKTDSLKNDNSLWEAANIHAEYLQKKKELSHFQNKKKFKTPFDRVKIYDASFNSVAENIAYVSVSTVLRQGKEEKREYKSYEQMAKELVDNWLKSKPHLKNIKDRTYAFSGLALVYDQETERVYAVQVFGGK